MSEMLNGAVRSRAISELENFNSDDFLNMKKGKSKSGKGSGKKSVSISNKVTEIKNSEDKEFVDLDDEDIGFGGWLKSGDGIEWMRLFVIGNSLIVFLTMTWPQIQSTSTIIKELIFGED